MKYFCEKCRAYTERNAEKCCSECGVDLKDASIAPDTVIAGYKIIREIGRGANGIVYLAEQTSLDRQIALKILPDAKAEDPDFVKGFLKEARAAARLNHPAIIQVYDAGVTNNGIYFLAMELIDGKSLEDIIQSKGALKPKNAIKIALELAQALEYSWDKEQMFHGDIKPANIMIRKDGQAKLADFGLAKTIFDEKSDEIMATPMYAPPEVIRAEYNKIGFKSDMYSFGVTLYEVLCGVPPFNEPDCQKVLDMHLKKKHVPLIGQNPQVDKSISDLIDKLLSKNPRKRPANWTNVVQNLQAFLDEKAEAKMRLRLFTGIPLTILLCGLAVLGTLYYNYNKNKNEKKKSPEIIKKTAVRIKPAFTGKKKKPAPETVKPAPVDKAHEELQKLLSSAAGFSGNILAASRLRFRALKLSRNTSLSETEQAKLAACLAKLNNYLKKAQEEAEKREQDAFISALKKEKQAIAAKLAGERAGNLLLARKNKIFKLTADFATLKQEQQTVKNLTALLNKDKYPDRKSNEYKILTFLTDVLPHKYNREAVILENIDQFIGKKLPWKIKSQEYEITGGSWQTIHLKTQFSEGVFSRKKVRASSFTDTQWCSMLDAFLIKETIKFSEKDLKNTACWLLLNAPDKLFTEFIRKYCQEDTNKWFACRKLLSGASAEVAAYSAWLEIVGQFPELNRMVWQSIKNFKLQYGNTQVYGTVSDTLLDYQNTVSEIYPEAVIDRLQIKSLSMKDSAARVFSAYNRYGFLNCVPSETGTALRSLFNKKLKALAGNRDFDGQFGIYKNVPCGKVYGWLADSQTMKSSHPRYAPAFLDVDNWNYLTRIILKQLPQLKSDFAELKEDSGYPFILYGTGLAALRNCEWKLMDTIFLNYNELPAKNDADIFRYALFAGLAMEARADQYAREILDKYKFRTVPENEEIIITLLQAQNLLACNPVNEPDFDALVANARKHFSNQTGLEHDIQLLELLRRFVCAEFKPDNTIEPDIFRQTVYPHLHARLWLEAAARDKMLRRNSIKIPDLLNAAASIQTASAFRS
ncbi:MAG: serine/threonine-protein kinase, partial [Victivallaceae bacterium]|nr:serine/threonine-protein kinase [Victivallaceae bacterium]